MKATFPYLIVLLLAVGLQALAQQETSKELRPTTSNVLPKLAADPAESQSEGTLIFADDFERSDASPDKDDLGNGWTTNSAWRAPGKKQAAVKDGVVMAETRDGASHALVLFHPAGLRDGAVELRFKIAANERLSVEFADPACQTVHAGHLAMVRVSPGQLTLSDLKTGSMNLKVKERRLANKADPEIQTLLKSNEKSFPLERSADEWQTLRLSVSSNTLTARVDGKEIGSFTSEGFAHDTKAEIRINVPSQAWLDDVRIWKVN